MKNLIVLIYLFSSLAYAQMPMGMNPQDMKNMEKNMMSMMAGVEKMEQCMSTIDQTKIDQLGVKASQIEQKISQLCEQGNRDAAQQKAINFSKEMLQHDEMNKMRGCMKSVKSMMPSMPFDNMAQNFDTNGQHMCDR